MIKFIISLIDREVNRVNSKAYYLAKINRKLLHVYDRIEEMLSIEK